MKEAIRRKGARAVFFETRDSAEAGARHLQQPASRRPSSTCCVRCSRPTCSCSTTSARRRSRQWVEETLGLVVNTRYSERRVSRVFTTNLDRLGEHRSRNSDRAAAGSAHPVASEGNVRLGRASTDRIRAKLGPASRPTATSRAGRKRRRHRRRTVAAPPCRQKAAGQARAQLKPRERDARAEPQMAWRTRGQLAFR